MIGYNSNLSNYLRIKFGLDLVFHFSADKQPYGYTLIDNANKNTFKGSEVLALKELINNSLLINEKWFLATLEYIKLEKLGVIELDNILKENNLTRDGLGIINSENNEVFQLRKSDLDQLLNNTKDLSFYTVHNENDKAILFSMLNIPLDQIVVEDDFTTIQGDKEMYATLLMSIINSYPSVEEGLDKLSLSLIKSNDQVFLFDSANNVFIPIDNLLDEENKTILIGQFWDQTDIANDEGLESMGLENHFLAPEIENSTFNGSFNLFIADDIDDEQINGRNRRRKGMTRTNTR